MRLNELPCWEQVTLTWLPTFAFPPPIQQIPSGGGHPDAIVITWIPRVIAVFLMARLIPQRSWINCGLNRRRCEITEPRAGPRSGPARCGKAELEATGSRPRYQVSKKCKCFLNQTFPSSAFTCWNCFDSLTINPPPLHLLSHSYISSKWNIWAASAESAFKSVKCFHCARASPFPHCAAMNKLF